VVGHKPGVGCGCGAWVPKDVEAPKPLHGGKLRLGSSSAPDIEHRSLIPGLSLQLVPKQHVRLNHPTPACCKAVERFDFMNPAKISIIELQNCSRRPIKSPPKCNQSRSKKHRKLFWLFSVFIIIIILIIQIFVVFMELCRCFMHGNDDDYLQGRQQT
jgi:hypothetical protein